MAMEWEIDPLDDDNDYDDILSNDLEVGNQERRILANRFFRQNKVLRVSLARGIMQ